MLELQLPRPMLHALPRALSFDLHSSSSRVPKPDRTMQLPYPRITNGHELDSLRTALRAPLTPPEMPGSAVRVVSLPSNQGAGHQYGYQLPAIGNSRSVTAQRSPSPQRQQLQSSQDVSQTPRKKYSISPNLRVPTTISTPQEGLPQLAAEVSLGDQDLDDMTDLLGDVPFLVRKLDNSQAGRGCDFTTSGNSAPRSRCPPHDWIQEVGCNDFDNYPGGAECDSFGIAIHLQVEAHQSYCQGKAWQRVSSIDCRPHAR